LAYLYREDELVKVAASIHSEGPTVQAITFFYCQVVGQQNKKNQPTQ